MAFENTHDPSLTRSAETDVRLVRRVAGGSVSAWHTFIAEYSGLIYNVLARHLFASDAEEVRNVFVDTLEMLYRGELAGYRGESRLSTWLIVFTRRRAVDFYRRRHGRYRLPKGWSKLAKLDQRVLQLAFVDKLPLGVVVEILGWEGCTVTMEDVVRSVETIETTMDARYLNRLENEHKAKLSGAESVPMLKYIVALRLEHERKMSGNGADGDLIERELQNQIGRVRAAVASLSPEEQAIVRMRFEEGWTARRIAEETGRRQRRVYTLIDGILAKLRAALASQRGL